MTTDSAGELDTAATRAVNEFGIDHHLVTIGPVRSAAEAAAARGIDLAQLVKTLVVRRSAGAYFLVLVPGDREIDWPKLRAVMGARRLSMPSADEAFEATGYRRGTITPFGTREAMTVIMDSALTEEGELSIGSGQSGTAIHLASEDVISALSPTIADVTAPTA